MKVTLEFEAATLDEFIIEYGKFLQEPAKADARPPAERDIVSEIKTAVKKEKKLNKKPARELKGDVDRLTQAQEVATRSMETKNPTREDVHLWLQKVNCEANLATAKGLLDNFGATRLSDLPEESYVDFIEACQNVCNNPPPTAIDEAISRQ